jgi:hypothetical protein
MKKLSKLSKIFLFLAVLSAIIWVGSAVTRQLITYQLFEGPELNFKSYVTEQNLHGIYETILPSVTITFVSYCVFIISFILFLIIARINLKHFGWLFIITVVVFILMPFEIYLMTIDFKMISLLNSGNFETNIITDLILSRFKVLGSFTIIEILCYLAFVYFILFKPLQVIPKQNEN